MNNQQEQARSYFHHSARDWQSKAEAQPIEYNVIQARNRAALDIISRVPSVSDFLDVGCGTGQLAIHVAKLGIRSVGLDFAPDMIRVAEENNKRENASALFVCSSLFEAQHAPASYDVISAQGVIEYISLDELEAFLVFVVQHCEPADHWRSLLAIGCSMSFPSIHLRRWRWN